MAFYPDELSPIDRVRSLGKQTDSLSDIGTLKNRRQWKSLGLGKKDVGMNNFATIAEEKEEEISSDGSQGATPNAGTTGSFLLNDGPVANKKITFPKPRKYITSRVSDRKEDSPLRGNGSSAPLAFLGPTVNKALDFEINIQKAEPRNLANGLKSNPPDLKYEKSKEFIAPAQDFVQSYALSETPIESQWNEAFSEGVGLVSWSKQSREKVTLSKHDAEPSSRCKQKERRKSSGSSKSSVVTDAPTVEAKGGKKRRSTAPKNSSKTKQEIPSTSVNVKPPGAKGRDKDKVEKGRTLNMKEVVNVYKNLAYGSKEEIKSFVENLSFVKDEFKAESDKNLLSMMNLKALENKIKNFAKKSGKNQEASTSQEKKKPKAEKPAKRSRKAHIERLARHKVVKVPAFLSGTCQTNAGKPVGADKASERRTLAADKEPWKYVGMESALDKTYFVYPAYPPSVNLKNSARTNKTCAKRPGELEKKKKGAALKPSEPKVKGSSTALKSSAVVGGGGRSQCRNVSGSASQKGTNRSSAMTVCTVKFRPEVGQRSEQSQAAAADQSLLVYLHGTKPIHVKSPYSDKQFSRVKFFRKDERGMPLVKGIGRRAQFKGNQTVSVRDIILPERLTKLRSLDRLDFDEDIQNITDFLCGQECTERQSSKKTNEWEGHPKEYPKGTDAPATRNQRPRRRATKDSRAHRSNRHVRQQLRQRQGDPSQGTLSPDSLINEISKNIHHLQYLPDTEDNRKMIGEFFDELDQTIEESRNGGAPTLQKFHSTPPSDSFARIPILGY